MRYCADIGMFAIDRPRTSCKHASPQCLGQCPGMKACFNAKFEIQYPDVLGCAPRLDAEWAEMTAQAVREEFARKRHQTKRVRLMTRGETFSVWSDIAKVKAIIVGNPDTLWWVPTRAWRDPALKAEIEREIMPLGNVRLLASTDTCTTAGQWAELKASGWSTMYYGNDDATHTCNGDRFYFCPKTHKKIHGHCARCVVGCFSPKRVDIHLKAH